MVAVHGHAEPAIFYHQHATHQPTTPAGFVERGHGPGVGGDASLSPPVQASLQPTPSQTVNDVPDSVESAPNTEASMSGTSGLTAELSELPLANMKEKTPMCLINELARFNKVHALHSV